MFQNVNQRMTIKKEKKKYFLSNKILENFNFFV